MSKFLYDTPSEWELSDKNTTAVRQLTETEKHIQERDAIISNTAKYIGWSALQGFSDTSLAAGQWLMNKFSDQREINRGYNSSVYYYGLTREQLTNTKNFVANKWLTNEDIKSNKYYSGTEHQEGISEWALKAEWLRNKIKDSRESVKHNIEDIVGQSRLIDAGGFISKVAASFVSPEFIVGLKPANYLMNAFKYGRGIIGTTGKYAAMISPFAIIGGAETYLKKELATSDASPLDFAKSFAMTEAFAPVFAVGGKIVGSTIKPLIGKLYDIASHNKILQETVTQMSSGELPKIESFINGFMEKELPAAEEVKEAEKGIVGLIKDNYKEYKGFISELSQKYKFDIQNATKGELKSLEKSDLNNLHQKSREAIKLFERYDGLQNIEKIRSIDNLNEVSYKESASEIPILRLSQDKANALKESFGGQSYILDTIVEKGYKAVLSDLAKAEKPDHILLNKIISIRDKDILSVAKTRMNKYLENYNLPNTSLEGVQAITGGTTRRRLGRDSVDLHQQAKTAVYFQQFVSRLEKNAVADIFFDSGNKLDKEIVAKLFNRTLDQATDSGKIATSLASTFDYLLDEYHKIGLPIKESWAGYIGKMNYDPMKVGGSEKALNIFKDNVYKYIDLELSFPAKTKQEIENNLNEIFNNIKDGSFGGFGFASKYKLLHPKNAESAYTWMKLYNRGGNLLDVVSETLKGVGREIGIVERLGSNPKKTFDALISETQQHGKVGKIATFIQQNVFKEIAGASNYTLGKSFMNKLNAWEYVTKTQNIAIASQADMNNTMTVLQKVFGESLLGSIKQGVIKQEAGFSQRIVSDISKEVGYNISTADLRENSRYLKYLARSRISRADSGLMNKLVSFHDKASGISSWDRTLIEEQGGEYVSRTLYRAAIVEKINPAFKETLASYSITKSDLEFIRANAEFDGNIGYASMIGLNNPTQESVASYLGITIDKVTLENIKSVSDHVSEKAGGLFADMMGYFRLTPDAVDRAMWTKLADNPIWNSVTMFHGFAFSSARRILSLTFEDIKEARNFEELLGSFTKDVPIAFRHLAGSFILGYASLSLKRLADGLAPLNPQDPYTWMQSFIYGGGAAIYADYMKFFEKNIGGLKYKLPALLGAPINTVVQGYEATFKAGEALYDEEEKSKALEKGFRFVRSNIPAINYPYIKSAFNIILGWKLMRTLAPKSFDKMMDYREKEGLLINPEKYAY